MEGAGPTGERPGPAAAGRGDGRAASRERWGGVGQVDGGWGDGGVEEGEDEDSGITHTWGGLIVWYKYLFSPSWVGVSEYQLFNAIWYLD